MYWKGHGAWGKIPYSNKCIPIFKYSHIINSFTSVFLDHILPPNEFENHSVSEPFGFFLFGIRDCVFFKNLFLGENSLLRPNIMS